MTSFLKGCGIWKYIFGTTTMPSTDGSTKAEEWKMNIHKIITWMRGIRHTYICSIGIMINFSVFLILQKTSETTEEILSPGWLCMLLSVGDWVPQNSSTTGSTHSLVSYGNVSAMGSAHSNWIRMDIIKLWVRKPNWSNFFWLLRMTLNLRGVLLCIGNLSL